MSNGGARRAAELLKAPPYLIFALPRSRTAWLARFLTYRNWLCLHEHAINLRSPDQIRQVLTSPRIGAVETAAGPAWRLLRHWIPNLRMAVVRRPLDETIEAMIAAGERAGATYDRDALRRVMAYGNRCLDAISEQPGTLTVQYNELAGEEACRRIFEFCLPYRFDSEWWEFMRHQHVEVDLKKFFADYWRERDKVEKFKRDCKRELIRLVRCGELRYA